MRTYDRQLLKQMLCDMHHPAWEDELDLCRFLGRYLQVLCRARKRKKGQAFLGRIFKHS